MSGTLSLMAPRVRKPVFGLAGLFVKNMAKYAVKKLVYYIGYSM
jgi:hypothetical protein